MRKKIVMNEKMRNLLERDVNSNINISIQKFRELLLPKFEKEYDCITLFTGTEIERSEKDFEEFVKNMYTDKTGYEASNTETYMNSFFEDENLSMEEIIKVTIIVIEVWVNKLKALEPDSKFCFVISGDTEYQSVTMRFHKVRNKENMWIGDGWESYDEPLGYIIL